MRSAFSIKIFYYLFAVDCNHFRDHIIYFMLKCRGMLVANVIPFTHKIQMRWVFLIRSISSRCSTGCKMFDTIEPCWNVCHLLRFLNFLIASSIRNTHIAICYWSSFFATNKHIQMIRILFWQKVRFFFLILGLLGERGGGWMWV